MGKEDGGWNRPPRATRSTADWRWEVGVDGRVERVDTVDDPVWEVGLECVELDGIGLATLGATWRWDGDEPVLASAWVEVQAGHLWPRHAISVAALPREVVEALVEQARAQGEAACQR